ncbi:MAG: hypothetical protein WAX44_00015 [Minisyncoccia bacterium]
MKRQNIIKLLLHFSFLLPVIVLGHGTGGTFEEVVNGYKVDVGYEPEKVVSGESQRFDFDLYDLGEKEVVFTQVWVNISQGSKTVFAGGINKSYIGGAGMTFIFPSPGEHKINVRYENEDKSIVESSFLLEVEKNELVEGNSQKFYFLKNSFLFGIFGLILGFGLKYIIDKK